MNPPRTDPVREQLEDETTRAGGGWRMDVTEAAAAAPRGWREAGDIAAFWTGYAVFAAITFFGGLLAAALWRLLPRHIGTRVGQWMIMAAFRMQLGFLRLTRRFEFDLDALDPLREEGGLVIAPNHPALLDVLLVASRLPRITGIMKADLWNNVLLGGGARLAGYIRNDSPCSMVKRAVEEIGRGSQLLVFPEGTRSVRRPVNPFKPGFALIARRAGVPVQTVFIETATPFLGKGWPWWRRPAMPIRYRVRLGRRFMVDRDVKAFSAMLEQYFEDELRVTPPAHRDG